MYTEIVIAIFAVMTIMVFIVLHRVIKRTFDSYSNWEENDQVSAIKMIVDDINRAKERILLFSGTGETYNNEKILKALKKKDIPIKMVFENPNIGTTPLHDLVIKKPNMSLSFVETSDPNLRHFRVVDYDYVYFEKRHDAGSYKRYYKRLFNTRFLPAKYSKKFYSIKTQAIACENYSC